MNTYTIPNEHLAVIFEGLGNLPMKAAFDVFMGLQAQKREHERTKAEADDPVGHPSMAVKP